MVNHQALTKLWLNFFKHLGKNATKSLLALFNQTWNTHIPAEWKKAVILPILKRKKSASDLQNYRPISLTNIIAKVMERMVSNRLNWYLEHQQIIIPEQAGFRKYHSTNQQILRLSQEVKDALDKQLTTLAVFVDFKGAYDSIWRGKLMEKLLSLGVKGKMARWIYLSLNQRFCATRVNSSTSKYKQQRRGLPQGSVMSPSLFNVMINDLPPLLQTSTGIKAALFADDLVLWLSLPKKKEKELSTRMNDTLNILSQWAQENAMTVNTSKTYYQVFTLAHKTPKINLHLNNETIQPSSEPKYLGMYLDTKMTWKAHIEKTAEKARNRLNILKRLAAKQWGSSQSVLNHTYKIYIKPLLLYACETLITANTNALELVQNQAMRLITGGVRSTPIAALQIATNNIPIRKEIERVALLQYEKLLRMPSITYWSNYQ